MRTVKDPQPKTIPISTIEELKKLGYEPLQGGDASQANSDYFMVMVMRHDAPKDGSFDRGNDVLIVCPSFLRGELGIHQNGRSISY